MTDAAEHIHCPFCNSEEVKPYIQRKDGLTVHHCNSCGLGFVAMKELEDAYGSLAALYEKEYYHSDGKTGYTGYEAIPAGNFLWQPAFIDLVKGIKENSILDIGCATGILMELLKKQGAGKINGIEISGYAAAISTAKGFNVHQGSITTFAPGHGFDIITAFDVIEHIPDLNEFFARIYELLNPDGLLIFMTPDAGSEEALCRKEDWYGFNSSLEHIYYFSVPGLTSALKKTFDTDPVLYQPKTPEGQAILGYIRKRPSPDDAALKGLFLSNFGPEFVNAGNVIPVSVLLQRVGDQRYKEYLDKYQKPPEPASSKKEITIRQYRDGDEYGIVKLFSEVFGREMPLEEWNWKYKGQGKKVGSTVIHNSIYGITGHYGGVPVRMLHNGKEVRGIAICDVMIRPDFRGFLSLKRMHNLFIEKLVEDSVVFFYGFPTEHTLTLPAEKLKLYERVEPVYEASKETRFNNTLVRFSHRLFPMSFDDEGIDILWQELKNDFPLAVVRDRDYLRWRYKENPLYSYELWGLTKRWSKKLTALAVIRRDGQNLRLMDIICPRKALPSLLLKTENLAYASGLKTISLWLASQFHVMLKGLGFQLMPTGTTIPKSPHPDTLKKEEIAGKLFYTMGDTDYL